MRKERKRQAFIVGLVVAVALVVTLVLVLVPIPQQFNLSSAIIDNPEPFCTGIFGAQGTTVSFHWSSSGSSITFIALDCSTSLAVYQANGTNGSGSFVSTGAVYQFGTLCQAVPQQPVMPTCSPATVAGSYSSPLADYANGSYWTTILVIGIAVGWVIVVGASWRFLRGPS